MEGKKIFLFPLSCEAFKGNCPKALHLSHTPFLNEYLHSYLRNICSLVLIKIPPKGFLMANHNLLLDAIKCNT